MNYQDQGSVDLDAYDASAPARTNSYWWLWLPFIAIIVTGFGFAWLIWSQNDVTIMEAVADGFLAVGGLIIGLLAGIFGLGVGLLATVFALITAGGALAITGFVLASPVIALVLLWMLMRRSNAQSGSSSADYHDYDPY